MIIRADSREVVVERIKRKISETDPHYNDLSDCIISREFTPPELFTNSYYGNEIGLREFDTLGHIEDRLINSDSIGVAKKVLERKGYSPIRGSNGPFATYIQLDRPAFAGVYRRKAEFFVVDMSELEEFLDYDNLCDVGRKLEIVSWSRSMTATNILDDLRDYAARWSEIDNVSKINNPSRMMAEVERLKRKLNRS